MTTHPVITTDGWTCDECGQGVNGSGRDGESVRHVPDWDEADYRRQADEDMAALMASIAAQADR